MSLTDRESSQDIIIQLQEWYKSQCNSRWEHDYGISIESIDNPGWLVKINLTETEVANKVFSPLKEGNYQGENWIDIQKIGEVFQGAGDSDKLKFILSTFMNWVSS